MKVNIDFHVHTAHSCDGNVVVDKIVPLARKKSLHDIAITDHNCIDGAIALKNHVANDNFIVIVGEEIDTSEGEIAGLFLKRKIESGLSPEETIFAIKEQGGLVSVPHPFCRFRRSRLHEDALLRVIDIVDIIEVFNSRNICDADNKRALDFAQRYNKLMVVGSDAHCSYEYGTSYVSMEPFETPKAFKNQLIKADYVTRKSPLWVHFVGKFNKFTK